MTSPAWGLKGTPGMGHPLGDLVVEVPELASRLGVRARQALST